MENVEIASTLNEYADLLDIRNENPFRVRSYRKAAQTVAGLSRPVAQLIAAGEDLTALPGIGSSMAAHLMEIVATGSLGALGQMCQEIPETLTELMRLETLGPKKARKLYEALGITSVSELAAAIDAGKVEALPGFGKQTAANLRRAISQSAQHMRRFLLADADQLIQPLLEYLRTGPDLEALDVAGSYRRRQETVGDIDLLAICEHPPPLMQHFLSYPNVEHVDMAGTTRGTIILRSGLQVDLRIVARRSYGAALHYFTGSKAHNVAVRKLGVERGLRINEYGVFRVPREKSLTTLRRHSRARQADADTSGQAGRRLGGETEEEVFRAVGMTWVPPELREDRGEIQAAQQDALPTLISLTDIRGDLQMHSTWSDGQHTIEEMARACQQRGYAYCAMTDHSRSTRIAGGLDAPAFKKQWEEIAWVRQRLNGFVLLAGVELDILPDGTLDLSDDVLEHFDIVVIAVHSRLNMPKAQMTQRVLKALSHPAVDILAHPTGRQLHTRAPAELDLEDVFHAAREYDVALELDAQPQRLDLNEVHVQRARELGVKLVIDSDAHSIEHLRFMRYGIDQARRGWLEREQVVNTMSWTQLQQWLQRRHS
jgi:DNA polymerase (family 10)